MQSRYQFLQAEPLQAQGAVPVLLDVLAKTFPHTPSIVAETMKLLHEDLVVVGQMACAEFSFNPSRAEGLLALSAGDIVEVEDRDYDWFFVRSTADGNKGWVPAAVLSSMVHEASSEYAIS